MGVGICTPDTFQVASSSCLLTSEGMGPEEALCGWVTVLGIELTSLVDRSTMFELAKLGQLEPSLHSPEDSSVSTSQLGRMEGMRKLRGLSS